MSITVYTFEGDDGTFTTQDYTEARDYASHNGFAVIANEYEWADSELIDDYR